MWEWCRERNISIHVEHIPGQENKGVDRESRRTADSSDWKLHPKVFQRLYQQWGPMDVDLFAARPVWQNQMWYLSLPENLINIPLLLPQFPDLLLDPYGNPHPLIVQGHMQMAISAFRAALQLISASPSTEKAYSSAWWRWISWCSTKQKDTFPTTVTPVIEFLAAEFQEGKQYATLNT